MLRSQTVLTIHNLHLEGKSVQEIAQELKISRTTVRNYLAHPEAVIPKPQYISNRDKRSRLSQEFGALRPTGCATSVPNRTFPQ